MLKIRGIKKQYGDRVILNNLTLTLNDKGLYFIVGDSGVGKTTLLNVLGLLDDEFEGSIEYNGKLINPKEQNVVMDYHRDVISFVFQDYNLLNYLSVEENIMLSCSETKKQQVYETIDDVNLKKVKNNCVDKLSGGEKQRAAIARALCRDTTIILADEPTGNLDKENSGIVLELLKKAAKDKLVVVVTHNREAAVQYGDYIIELDGKSAKTIEITDSEKDNKFCNVEEKKYIGKKSEKKRKLEFAFQSRQLAWKYIKKNVKKFYPTAVVMIICMIFVGVFFSVFLSTTSDSEVINYSILENDKFTAVSNGKLSVKEQVNDAVCEKLEKDRNVKYLVKYYKDLVVLSADNAGKTVTSSYCVIEDTPFFQNRYKDLVGKIPESKNEILLSGQSANMLLGDTNCIGKSVSLSTSSGTIFKCKVTGYRKNEEGMDKHLYITKELADEISIDAVNSDFYSFSSIENDCSYDCRMLSITDDSYKLLCGRMPQNAGEVAVVASGLNDFLESRGGSRYYSYDEVVNGKFKKEDMERIVDSDVVLTTLNYTIIKNLKVVGVVLNNSTSVSDTTDFVFLDNKNNKREAIYNAMDIYVYSSEEKDMMYVKKILEKKSFTCESNTGNLGQVIYSHLTSLVGLLALVLCVVLPGAMMIVFYGTKSMMSDRIYEVGVLKSLGASKKYIMRLLVFQNVVIGILSGTIGACILFFVTELKLFKISNVPILVHHLELYFVLIVFGVLLAFLSSTVIVKKVLKKSVVECISKKYL